MLAEMKKKILVLTNIWNADYISQLIRGAQKRIGGEAADFYIFNGYDIVGNQLREKKECEIYTLPDAENYDGILVVINSADSRKMVEGLIASYKKLGKKFICAEMELEDVCYAGVYNYRAMYRMIEHMIEVHNCRNLTFIGGPAKHWDGISRLKAFRDCLAEHHLPIDEEQIIEARFEYADGIKAYQTLKQKKKHLADAVICANDDMAMGYCQAAAQDGYYPPEDFKITGFDNKKIAHYAVPSITSVNRNWEQLGEICMNALLKLIDGEVCPQKIYADEILVFNESCGCKKDDHDVRGIFAQDFYRRKQEESLAERQRQVRQLLCGSLNTQEMCENLVKCCEIFEIEKIALYLNQNIGKVSKQQELEEYADRMLVLENGGMKVIDRHKEPVPKEWLGNKKSEIFLFAPLHFLSQTFGYCVMPYKENFLLTDNHKNLMDSISLALENIHQRLELDRMYKEVHHLYILDSLTGIWNRCGYNEEAEKIYQLNAGKVYVVYLDVDDLKIINDTYGHKMGDRALKRTAEAMRYAFDEELLVRMGGDEFLVIGKFETEDLIKEKMEKFHRFWEDFQEKETLPFKITVSMGYIYNEGTVASVDELVQVADHQMYINKQIKKQNTIKSGGE